MSSPLKAVVDHHVDRPGVDAERSVQLTGTNRLIGLIALICDTHAANAYSSARGNPKVCPQHQKTPCFVLSFAGLVA
jgi:hypothetical protein